MTPPPVHGPIWKKNETRLITMRSQPIVLKLLLLVVVVGVVMFLLLMLLLLLWWWWWPCLLLLITLYLVEINECCSDAHRGCC